jgi:hypothetical protein
MQSFLLACIGGSILYAVVARMYIYICDRYRFADSHFYAPAVVYCMQSLLACTYIYAIVIALLHIYMLLFYYLLCDWDEVGGVIKL